MPTKMCYGKDWNNCQIRGSCSFKLSCEWNYNQKHGACTVTIHKVYVSFPSGTPETVMCSIELRIVGNNAERRASTMDSKVLGKIIERFLNNIPEETTSDVRDEMFLELLTKCESLIDCEQYSKARALLNSILESFVLYPKSHRYHEIYQYIETLDERLSRFNF